MVPVSHNEPLVSIGLPVFNGELHIRRALDSLLAQEFEDFELIISDNASTDATQQICLEYASKDPRVRYHRNETNLGYVKNFNRVFELSSGKHFMWAADHDIWDPRFLPRCVEVLERDPSVVLCYPRAASIDYEGKVIEGIDLNLDTRGLGKLRRFHAVLWKLDHRYPIYGLIRSSTLERTHLFGSTVMTDVVLLNELSLLGAFACLPELLFYLRKLPDHGDWDEYLKKLKIESPPRSALYLYLKAIREYVQTVNKHLSGYSGKAFVTGSVFLCMLVKYNWVPLSDLISSIRKASKG